MNILAINLDRDTERWRRWQEHAGSLGLKHTRISGVWFEERPRGVDFSNYLAYDGRLSNDDGYLKGQLGCTLSHMKALDYARQRRWKSVLVLEDDARFVAQPRRAFREVRRLAADMVLLGGNYEDIGAKGRVRRMKSALAIYYTRDALMHVLAQQADIDCEYDIYISRVLTSPLYIHGLRPKLCIPEPNVSSILGRPVNYLRSGKFF